MGINSYLLDLLARTKHSKSPIHLRILVWMLMPAIFVSMLADRNPWDEFYEDDPLSEFFHD